MIYRIALSLVILAAAAVGLLSQGAFETQVSGPQAQAPAVQPTNEDSALKGFKIP